MKPASTSPPETVLRRCRRTSIVDSDRKRFLTVGNALWLLLALFAFCISFSIAAAQSFLFLAILAWVYGIIRKKLGSFRAPSFWMPIAAYALATLLSALFSPDKARSFVDAKELFLLAIPLLLVNAVDGAKRGMLLLAVLLYGACLAGFWGITDYALSAGGLRFRETGAFSHYMTYGGVLMLAASVLFAGALFSPKRKWLFAAGLAPVLPALLVSYSRNAWVGLFFGVVLLVAFFRARWLAAIPPALLVLYLLLPAPLQQRARSVFDLQHDPSNRDRILMLKSGLRMFLDHPVTGVGPAMVQAEYPGYRYPGVSSKRPSHLHNNVVQIAAERGFPGLAAWLWLIGVFFLNMFAFYRKSGKSAARWVAAGAMAALVSLFVSGFFEYNFGDSEVKMFLLVILGIPYTVCGTGDAEGNGSCHGDRQ
jgi:O-antigen ligase